MKNGNDLLSGDLVATFINDKIELSLTRKRKTRNKNRWYYSLYWRTKNTKVWSISSRYSTSYKKAVKEFNRMIESSKKMEFKPIGKNAYIHI